MTIRFQSSSKPLKPAHHVECAGQHRMSMRRGFTLTELLVVVAIIVLLISLAVPALNVLSGNKSQAAASNIIGGMLTRARADAVGLQVTKGIAIYKDNDSGRYAVTLIEAKPTPFAIWADNLVTDPVFASQNPIHHPYGQYVQTSTSTYYVCIQDHYNSVVSTDPNFINTSNTGYWRLMIATEINAATSNSIPIMDVYGDGERVLLPPGVAVASVCSAISPKYISRGIILFDGNGACSSIRYCVNSKSEIGVASRILTSEREVMQTPVTSTTLSQMYSSQLGIMLLDSEELANNSATSAISDSWIDNNATPLMINRHNGTLIKGE